MITIDSGTTKYISKQIAEKNSLTSSNWKTIFQKGLPKNIACRMDIPWFRDHFSIISAAFAYIFYSILFAIVWPHSYSHMEQEDDEKKRNYFFESELSLTSANCGAAATSTHIRAQKRWQLSSIRCLIIFRSLNVLRIPQPYEPHSLLILTQFMHYKWYTNTQAGREQAEFTYAKLNLSHIGWARVYRCCLCGGLRDTNLKKTTTTTTAYSKLHQQHSSLPRCLCVCEKLVGRIEYFYSGTQH